MPLYEYICRQCNHAFEMLQRMGERGDDLRCPMCNQVGADRQLSTFSGHASHGGASAASSSGCGPGAFT